MKGTIARHSICALAGALMAGSLSVAQGPGGPGMSPRFQDHRPPMERAFQFDGAHGQFWNNPRIVDKLKLTDDQRKAMDSILQEHRVKLIDLRGNVEKAELEMQPLMRADQPNEGAVLAQIDKIAQARAELEKANARFLLAIRGKFTPDQWKQVQQFREDHGHDGQWGRGERGPGNGFHHQGPPPPSGQQGPPAAPPAPGVGEQ